MESRARLPTKVPNLVVGHVILPGARLASREPNANHRGRASASRIRRCRMLAERASSRQAWRSRALRYTRVVAHALVTPPMRPVMMVHF